MLTLFARAASASEMFILKPTSPVEMTWTAIIVGIGLAGFAFLCLLAWLDSQEDEDLEKEGFVDYKPDASEEEAAGSGAGAEATDVAESAAEAVTEKFYTRWQTADVVYHKEPHMTFQQMEFAPILPPHLKEAFKANPVTIETNEGWEISWWKDGVIIVKDREKKMTFWPVPTLDQAVWHKGDGNRGTLFKFNSDGSAVVAAYGSTYYFGPLEEGTPAEGEELADGHDCSDEDGSCPCYFLENIQHDNYYSHCEDMERDYYDSEDDMFSRCDDCTARHDPKRHNCRP
jgi:hypothetical protein